MQTPAALPAILILAAGSLAAAPQPQLNCDDPGHHSRLAATCEMREQALAPVGGSLAVDGRENGGISVKGWERSDLLVRSRVETAAPTEAEARDLARQIRVETSGAGVRAVGPAKGRDRHWSVSYEIFVPSRCALSLTTQNGGIHVSGVTGQIAFSATNGGVSLARLGGNVRGHTTNGGLHIELSGTRWDGAGMDVRTTNGGVMLSVPRDYSAHLEVGTTNGAVNLGIPITVQGRLDRTISTDLGSGGATIRAITTNGGIMVNRQN